ncbi:MAG TPA: CYCXC family (seleno)protein [Terriglobales bacterium]|jgi:hypothetical protein|nr:CYCXC family (seleno)protein [Terriglobales bacterium]
MKRCLAAILTGVFAVTLTGSSALAGDEPVPPVQRMVPLPEVLSPDKFDRPLLKRAYAAAARNREIVSQLPCYCWCSRFGHRSLLDCFVSSHGANCDICIKEVLLAEEMVRKGKPLADIRSAIIRQEYRAVPLR